MDAKSNVSAYLVEETSISSSRKARHMMNESSKAGNVFEMKLKVAVPSQYTLFDSPAHRSACLNPKVLSRTSVGVSIADAILNPRTAHIATNVEDMDWCENAFEDTDSLSLKGNGSLIAVKVRPFSLNALAKIDSSSKPNADGIAWYAVGEVAMVIVFVVESR